MRLDATRSAIGYPLLPALVPTHLNPDALRSRLSKQVRGDQPQR